MFISIPAYVGYSLLIFVVLFAICYVIFRPKTSKNRGKSEKPRIRYEKDIEPSINGEPKELTVTVHCLEEHKKKIDDVISESEAADHESLWSFHYGLNEAAKEIDPNSWIYVS